ncbi:hypothetical protein [Pyruvatibacter sp.]
MSDIKEWFKDRNIPWTREAFIGWNWPDGVPDDEWTAEHEEQVPEELQEGYQPPGALSTD